MLNTEYALYRKNAESLKQSLHAKGILKLEVSDEDWLANMMQRSKRSAVSYKKLVKEIEQTQDSYQHLIHKKKY